jgi:XisI protein
MDKIDFYKKSVRRLAEEVANLGQLPDDNIKTQLVTDDEHGHYLLYFNGWKGYERTYGCFFHIDVMPDGKVWLQYDGTDLVLAEMLLEKGIPKEDIVLGFHAPPKRPHTGFALA